MNKEKEIEKILFLEVPRTSKYALNTTDKIIKKLNEEFDEIQTCVKVLEHFGIDIKKANKKHIEKLKGRGICL